MMDHFYDLLDHYDLNNEVNIKEKLLKLGKIEIEDLCTSLSKSLRTIYKPSEFDIFTLVANGSLSANHNGLNCSGLECRLKKMAKLGTFSAMYANKVYVPNYFSFHIHQLKVNDLEEVIGDLHQDLLLLNRFRPFFEKGYLDMVNYGICEHCSADKLATFDREFNDALIEQLFDFYLPHSKVIISEKDDLKLLVLDTSEDLLEHGRSTHHFDKKHSGFLDKLPLNTSLTKEQIKETGIVHSLISRNILNQRFEYIVTKIIGAPYITNSTLSTNLLSRGHTIEDAKVSKALEQLFFDTPILDGLPPEKILEIRESDNDAFEIYRTVVRKSMEQLIKNKNTLTPKIVEEFYNDNLRLEVLKIDRKVEETRKKSLKKLATNVGILGISLGIGFYTGFISPEVLKGIGAFTGFAGLGTMITDLQPGPELTTNDLYFLWRANKLRV